MALELVSANDLSLGYNRVPAVEGLSLSVREGAIVALLGTNGAGKTTSLLGIAGLISPLAGEIRFLGTPVQRLTPSRLVSRGLVLLPDDRGLFPSLTVDEHLRLCCRRSDRQWQAQILERLPAIAALGKRKVGLLSGGEQQMLALAMRLSARPKLLLVDELSLGLAPIIVQEILDTIRDVVRAEGMGVILVEQHIDLALAVSDHAIVLSHGRISLTGPASELMTRRDQLEAAYFGERPEGGE